MSKGLCMYLWTTQRSYFISKAKRRGTVNIASQVDSPSLAAGFRFDDESLSFALLSALVVGLQVRVVVRQIPSQREEVVLTRELASKLHQRQS